MNDNRSHWNCAAKIVPVREYHWAPQDAKETFPIGLRGVRNAQVTYWGRGRRFSCAIKYLV